jgi:hypothetical protein
LKSALYLRLRKLAILRYKTETRHVAAQKYENYFKIQITPACRRYAPELLAVYTDLLFWQQADNAFTVIVQTLPEYVGIQQRKYPAKDVVGGYC